MTQDVPLWALVLTAALATFVVLVVWVAAHRGHLRGEITVPRAVKAWAPDLSTTDHGNWRAAVRHPAAKDVLGIATHADPEVALHAAQRQAVYLFNQGAAQDRGLRRAAKVSRS